MPIYLKEHSVHSVRAFRLGLLGLSAFCAALAGPSARAQVAATVGDLPAGGTITLEFLVTVDNPLAAGVDQVSNQGTVSGDNFANVLTDDPSVGGGADPTVTPVAGFPDLSLSKTDGNATAVPGGTVAYSFAYVNTGNQGATGIVLTDTVPANTVFETTGSTVGWSCADGAPAGTVCTLAVGPLPGGGAGGAATFVVTVVNPVPAGVTQISNTATIADDGANGADPTPANNTASDTTPIDAEPDLTLTKSDGGATATPGGTVTYTLNYANAGDQGATGVVLTDTVPANTVFETTGSTPGWSCADGAPAGSVCTLAVGSLAGGGAGGAATFVVTVASPVPAGVSQITNTASIADDGANGVDPTPANNSATDTTPVDAEPDLTLTKSDGGATATPGGTVTYTLTYANAGDQGATGVVLTDTVPTHSAFETTGSSAGWSCADGAPAGSVCTLAIGALAGGGGGGAATFVVTVVSPLPAGVTQIANTATVADDGGNGADPTPANNAGSDTTPVTAQPDLHLEKAFTGAQPQPGDPVEFTLSYRNAGNQGATGVVLTETVPANSTFNAAASAPGWACAPDVNPGAICTLAVAGELVPSPALVQVLFVVDLDDPLPPGVTELENCASIADDAANGADPTPGDNSACATAPLDQVPPTVLTVDSDPTSGGGDIVDCEEVRVDVAALLVTFDEPMANPPGDAGAADVTNPANYLVVQPGPDHTFQTASCAGGVAGDDVAVPIATVTYTSAPEVARLNPAAPPLASSLYRVHVCATLTDLSNNPLDGDGGTPSNADNVRGFRVETENLFVNGQLDCGLVAWTAAVVGSGAWSHDTASDADGSPESGSAEAELSADTGSPETMSIGQCVPVAAGDLDFEVKVRLATAPLVLIGVPSECEFYSGPACGGTALGFDDTFPVVGDTAGVWVTLPATFNAPAGTQSALCKVTFDDGPGDAFTGVLDGLRLTGDEVIFADGFESGDTSAWSASVGVTP